MSNLAPSSFALAAVGFADAEELEDELWRKCASTYHMMQLETASMPMAQEWMALLCPRTRMAALILLRNRLDADHVERHIWFQAAGILHEVNSRVKDPVCIYALSEEQLPVTLDAIHSIALKFDTKKPSFQWSPMLKREQEVLAAIGWKMKPTLESWALLLRTRLLVLTGDTAANFAQHLHTQSLSLAEQMVLLGSWPGSLRRLASACLVIEALQWQAGNPLLGNPLPGNVQDLKCLLGGACPRDLAHDVECTKQLLREPYRSSARQFRV